jgi:hypothetical protein
MAKVGFAVPILPGKEDLATKRTIEEIRRRLTAYEQSRETVWDWTRSLKWPWRVVAV